MTNTISTINSYLDHTTEILGKLNGLPGYALVFIWCIAFGYVLRSITRFPNDAIPVAVVLWGCIWNSVIADPMADNFPFRIWLVKNVVVGGIIGFAAWFIHWQILSRVEDKMPILRRFVTRQAVAKLEHETAHLEKKIEEVAAEELKHPTPP